MTLATLLLADGRFPAGGHAHSGGVEAAVSDGRVHDIASLAAYVRGRLHTAGLTDAALAVATARRLDPDGTADPPRVVLRVLDAEADARMLAPPLRHASRRLGRQLVRVASRCWASPIWADVALAAPDGLHQACTWGVVGRVAGIDDGEVARLAVHHAVSTPAQAGVRLLGLDPFAVAGVLAAVQADGEAVARRAVVAGRGALHDLPAGTGPVVEIAAVEHATWDMRMFTT
ncbi:MAG: urease accessory UreF family protein [Acidimicrobiia bacterium]